MRNDHPDAQLFRSSYSRRDVTEPGRGAVEPRHLHRQGPCRSAEARPQDLLRASPAARELCRYLRSNPDIDADDNVFALTGNQERKYGGNECARLPAGRRLWRHRHPRRHPVPCVRRGPPVRVPRGLPSRRDLKAIANVTAELTPIKLRPAFHSDFSRALIEDEKLRPGVEHAYDRPLFYECLPLGRCGGGDDWHWWVRGIVATLL